MAVSAATSLRWPRVQSLARARLAVPLGLGLLAVASVLLRTTAFGAGYWIDEGLSIGIADRPLTDIPGVLRQDGSPPLYYMLLHLWIRAVGDTGEAATHALSLLFATVAIPVTWALVRALFGARAAWIAAVLVAANPFLTRYAQETRMYALAALLALVAVACFAGAFALERGRRWTLGFAVAMAALLWTHNWGLFLGAGLAVAWAVLVWLSEPARRGPLVREGLVAAATIAILYAPWLPTMIFQAAHTGAPWANAPELDVLVDVPERLLGYTGQWVLLIGAGAGFVALVRPGPRAWSPQARAAVAMLVAAVVTLALPWALSQVSPAWATRYLAVAVAPLLLFCAVTLARAGPIGIGVTALTALLWLGLHGPNQKGNVADVAEAIAPSLQGGDLVISTQPEQVPVLHHYLTQQGRGDLRWATLWGPLTDLGVTDWRDGTERLERTDPRRDLAPLLDRVRPGQRVALVEPDVSRLSRWRAPWTALVRQRSAAWQDWMLRDPRFRVVHVESPSSSPPSSSVRAVVLVRKPVG